jgi:hypothetical protein
MTGWFCIRLCCGKVLHCLLVTGHWFVGIVGTVSWLLVCRFLLPAGLQMASRMFWISCWIWESCIIIFSMAEGEVMGSGRGWAGKMTYSLSYFIRVSTVALRAAVLVVDWQWALCRATSSNAILSTFLVRLSHLSKTI